MSPFILHCFSFSLTGERRWEIAKVGVDELYGLYYLLRHAIAQMHVCLIASPIQIITKHVVAVYLFK